jgi:DNA-binding transcriptional MerR regulator
MKAEYRMLTQDEAAAASSLEVVVVRHYAELGLISPSLGYGEAELAELRCVRRLLEDLELDHPAIEVVLRMRRQIQWLQEEVRRLSRERRPVRARSAVRSWVDAEWDDVY